MRRIHLFGFVSLSFALAIVLGCGNRQGSPPRAGNTADNKADEEEDHRHLAGPHRGTVADWGGGKYHVEFCVDHAKKEATVYLLKANAKTPAPIKTDKLLLSISQPSFQVELKARVQEGDPQGTASRFVGNHENLAKEQEFAGTISGEVDGKPYAGDFKEEPGKHEHKKNHKAHNKVQGSGTALERELFLKPSGIYTAADIEANGKTVPSVKYQGISWPHDDNLRKGDKVCPVTTNKADPRCNWIVNGKKYEFCCTPCLDKFVKWAKQDPKKIKTPEEYV